MYEETIEIRSTIAEEKGFGRKLAGKKIRLENLVDRSRQEEVIASDGRSVGRGMIK